MSWINMTVWLSLVQLCLTALWILYQRHRKTGLRNWLWNKLAVLLAKPKVANWLIDNALGTPYTHITSTDGKSIYMGRWWLFNPYHECKGRMRFSWFPWSVRVHWIKREDLDRHLHDHPWNARTVILKGHYVEKRLMPDGSEKLNLMRPGATARLRCGEYHRIVDVGPSGAWTLFITGPYREVWGFLVDGKKVPWRQYLGLEPR